MKQRPPSVAPPLERPVWYGFGFATMMLVLAQAVRWLIDPYTGDAIPLGTMLVAVAFTVCHSGWKPAAALSVAGYFVGLWLFVPPRYSFKLLGELGIFRAIVYTITATIVIFLCEMIRRAWKRHAMSEARVVSILENMHGSFCSVNRDWRITLANRSAEVCFGAPRSKLMSQTIWEVVPGILGTTVETELRTAMRDGTPVQFETNHFAPDSWHAVTATASNGELSIFFTDITANRAHLDQLERLVDDRTAALQRMVAELEAFSYTLVHDMRAPLRSITGFAEVLALDHAQQLDGNGRKYLTRIQRSAARMDQLIVDILDYSQLSRQQPELGAIQLKDTFREILQSHPDFHADKADIEQPASLPVVRGNDALLTQCFSNILHNATKFVAPGVKPRIRISSRVDGDTARVEISDNGIGICPEAVGRIFEPFRREHSHYDGTGIGLAIVQRVVEQLGGRVGVESEPGQGSRFWVELKVAAHGAPAPESNHANSSALV